MLKSTHKAEVFQIEKIDVHPNADKLGIVHPFNGPYSVCVNLDDWEVGDLAVYVVSDSLVPLSHQLFEWLKDPAKPDQTHMRIKVKKLRGVYSQGLLIPAPFDAIVGDDVAERLGIKRYEPPEKIGIGEEESPMDGDRPHYDIDAYARYSHTFEDGELVVITEKLHGSSSRFAFQDDRFWAGSRNTWKRRAEPDQFGAIHECLWWKIFDQTPGIKAFLEANPTLTIYGETYGSVQDLKYDMGPGKAKFAAFDVLKPEGWMNWDEAYELLKKFDVPTVPILYGGPLNKATVMEWAEGKSTIASHVREGCVVKPVKERWDQEVGRVILKIVGNAYLEL